MDPEAAQGTDQESAAERREAFRKAGEEYFEQLLLDAATKGDAASPGVPLPVSTSASTGVSAPSAQSGTPLTAARTPGKRRRRGDVENADVAAMGALIERSKNVFLMAVLTATRAAWTVLLKGSYVVGIATPGLLCFFHKLAVVAVIYGLSMWKVLEVGPISRSMVQNSVVHVTIHACKQLALFGMLLHGSVYGMLAWTTALPELVGAGVAMRVHGTGPRPEDRSIMAMVVAGLVLELAYDQHQGGLTWAMFIIWTGLLTLEVLWEMFHRHPTSFAAVLGEEVLSQLTAVCEREKQIPEPDMVLLRHSVPAVPILLLGLLLQEGEELLEHDLTVPSATMMLLSCAAFASAEAALMLMPHSPSEHSQALLAAATQGLIILLDFFERAHSNSVFALIGVVTTCAAVAALKLRGGSNG